MATQGAAKQPWPIRGFCALMSVSGDTFAAPSSGVTEETQSFTGAGQAPAAIAAAWRENGTRPGGLSALTTAAGKHGKPVPMIGTGLRPRWAILGSNQ
jgi:hypothetical protein